MIKWGSVGNHERNCNKKPYPCPTAPLGVCSWHGNITDIRQHFEQKHSGEIMHRNIIGIRLHKSVEVCKLIKTNNEYYILHIYFNTVQNVLKFNIMQLKDAKSFCAQNYQLTLHAHDFSKCITVSTAKCEPYTLVDHNSIEGRNVIESSVLKFLTNNNPLVLCEINFDAEEKKKVNGEMMKLIECPLCNDCMSSPIYQCQTGHSFCKTCISKLNDCPLCHRVLTQTRNYVLEDVINQFLHINDVVGYSSACTNINIPESRCDLYKCPLKNLKNCMWNGDFRDLVEHCKNNHGGYIDGANSEFLYTLTVDSSERFRLLYFNGSLFRFCRKYENEEFSVNIQLVGPGKQSGDYYYGCSLVDANMVNNRKQNNHAAFNDVYLVLNEDENSFDHCFKISSSFLKSFKDINSLCCRVIIYEVNQ
ncbi:hypothetical protein ILUMI_23454 [Ignelater luminosus]|uniref:RING-type E3 ubiquitin transferase n=1 Tax=Ignelater luminosus TaxID=2038154 RepID=A0A8K0G1L9_IGNLU|nr:hypothetical protein ILUMI_23454 [Ignelater luminosus]